MYYNEIWGYVASAIGAGGITQLINWRYQRRKNREEIKADQIANMQKAMQDFYEPLVEKQNMRIHALEERNDQLEKEISSMRVERREMETAYQRQIVTLQDQIVQINKALGIKAQGAIRTKEPTVKR